MKNIKNIITKSSMMCLGMLALTSCTDDQDWSIDSAYDRLFGATDISVDATATEAIVDFKTKSGVKQYIIEISTDSLSDDNEEIGVNSIVDTTSVSPDTIKGLTGETSYFLRIKSIAEGQNDSKWKYYKKDSGARHFKTDAEQIFAAITDEDRSDTQITLNWEKGAAVTTIEVLDTDDKVLQTINLDAEAVANGTYTVSGLTPTTTYKFVIYNNNTKRGTISASTAAAMPAANYKYNLGINEDIDQVLINQLAETAKEKAGSTTNYSVTIGIAAGDSVNFHGLSESGEKSNIKLPDGMSITFFGLAGNAPTIKMQKNLDIAGSHAYVKFQHVNIVDNGAGYFINQSSSATVEDFTMEDVEVSGFTTSFFRLQGSNDITINHLNLINGIFHDMVSGYGFIHVDANSKGVVENIKINNSTFYNIAVSKKMFIYSNKTNMNSIEIDHMTMYNCIGGGNYFVDFGDKAYGPATFTISNTIFAKSADDVTNKNIRSAVSPTVSNSYSTNDFYKVISGVEAWDVASTAIFTNPAKADFTLKGTYADKNAGDSRWISAE